MSAAAQIMVEALGCAGAMLRDIVAEGSTVGLVMPNTRLRERLHRLAQVADEPLAPVAARLVTQAITHLRTDHPDPAAVTVALDLLGRHTPEAEALRLMAVTECLLSTRPNLGRLADHYRHRMRNGATPPATAVVAAIHTLVGELLPAIFAGHPPLRACLPDGLERTELDRLRDALRPPAPPRGRRAYEPGQQIVATDGAQIAHVHQTIVYGDMLAGAELHLPDLADLFARYCAFLVDTFAMFDFRGILQIQHAARLPLDEVYVPLTGDSPQGTHHRRTSSGPAPLHHYVRDLPLLVVLGEPGMGKSTLVRYVLLALVREEGAQRIGLEGTWLPIFFPLAGFADARAAGRRDLAPLDYLRDYYLGRSQPDYTPLFRRALALGRALVLLDGLDEVRSDRLDLVRTLEAFVREWDGPGNRFLATSRNAGYDAAPLSDALFTRVMIQPLGDADIRHFIERWSRVYESAMPAEQYDQQDLERRIEAHAASLSEAVFGERGITDLARKPLLLTILALIHNQGTRLPDRRVDLYRLCVEALAETWNRARSLSGREISLYLGDESIDERFVVNLLGPAALWMHATHPGGSVEQAELEQHIAGTLMHADGLPRGQARRLARGFVELVRHETGLLQEREPRRFAFIHQTFEEYLAARGLLESVTINDPDDLLRSYAADPRWREVLRLAVGASPQREAQRLLLQILAAPAPAEAHGRPVVLAGECLRDIGRGGATRHTWDAVIERLALLLEDRHVPLATRIAAGHMLGQLGDPRLPGPLAGVAAHDPPALETAPYWCTLPAGPFWYSERRTTRSATDGPAPLQQVTLANEPAIARYLVTGAQYRSFLEDGGYHERRWWSEAGWAFVQEVPFEGSERASRQGQPGTPALPMVGISWYEAAAYCRWLTRQGRQAGWLAPGEQLRLPTDMEWERAARHTDCRRYPWGDEPPDAERANYEATGLHGPTPVGCFPRGAAACGALDLAGNVWEWTASRWDSVTEPAPWSEMARTDRPVIRGGAFSWHADYLSCEARSWFNPGYRYNLLGFRMVRAKE